MEPWARRRPLDESMNEDTASADVPAAVAYEVRLARNPRWALTEGSRYFDKDSAVHSALRKICRELASLDVPYAVAGGLAMFAHGFRRFTEDVDVLTTREGLRTIHSRLEGLGYVRLFTGSKNLRDAQHGVRIDFLVAGQYPGDGKEKPVAFPEPSASSVEIDGIRFLSLSALIELKLASGMTSTDRGKDIADVQELIRTLDLAKEFGGQLHPFVRGKFEEIWRVVNRPRRLVCLWPKALLALDAEAIRNATDEVRQQAATLQEMLAAGVTIDADGAEPDDSVYLVTTDPDVARRFGMHDESEFWPDEADGPEPPTGSLPE